MIKLKYNSRMVFIVILVINKKPTFLAKQIGSATLWKVFLGGWTVLNHIQCLLLHQKEQSHLQATYNVPQGSILGPLLFSVFNSHYMYVDDTQLCFFCATWEAVINEANKHLHRFICNLNATLTLKIINLFVN